MRSVLIPGPDGVYEFVLVDGNNIRKIKYYESGRSIPEELTPEEVPEEVWKALLDKF